MEVIQQTIHSVRETKQTPTILNSDPQQQLKPQVKNKRIFEQLSNTLRNRKFRNITKKLKQLIFKHSEKSLEKYKQQWQKQQHNSQEENNLSIFILKKSDKFTISMNLIFLILYLILFWYSSNSIVFQIQPSQILWINILWIITFLSDICITINIVKNQNSKEIKNRLKIIIFYLKNQSFMDFLGIIYGIFNLCNINQFLFIQIFQIIALISLLIKIKNKYEQIRLYQNQFQKEIITLIVSYVFLLFIAHIFALLIYSASFSNTQKNWIINLNIQQEQWQIKYLYSLYWAITTMVTVGYGDITPQNNIQILITIIIELIGTSIFGYLINIIGITLSELKKKKQIEEKQMSIADKLIKILSLQDDTGYRIKMCLKNNQQADNSFSLLEERSIIGKLSNSLKDQIIKETNTKVIKKSLFFLSNFTKEFQDKIALKLIRRIMHPNQYFVQIAGQQSLFLIKQGKVQIQIFKTHKNKTISKKVKEISVDRNSQIIKNNIYGYTSLIMRKKLELKALSKTFSIIYELPKKDFEEVLENHPLDYESVCQLRDNFTQINIMESIQVPSLVSRQQHFYPHTFLLLKKINKKNDLETAKRVSRPLFKRRNIKTKTIQSIIDSLSKNQIRQEMENSIKNINLKNSGSQMIIQTLRRIGTLEEGSQELKQVKLKKQIEQPFECLKKYTNYMKNSNYENVLKKYSIFKKYKKQAF